jgi:hypothetical protein
MTASRIVALAIAAAALAGAWPGAASAIEMSNPYRLPLPQNASLDLEAQSAAVGDTNGDGRLDVAFFAEGSGSSDASVDHVAYIYEQLPDGSMAEATHFSLWPGGVPKYAARAGTLAELTGDAKAELVLVEANGKYDRLVVLTRSGDGSYVEAAKIPSPLPPRQILATDLNHDGYADIVVQSDQGTGLSVHWGRGNLVFSQPVLVQGYLGRDISLGDADRDGVVDVLTSALHWNAGVQPGEAAIGINYGLRERIGGPLYDFSVPSIIDVPASAGSVAPGTFGGQPSLAVWHETMEGPDANNTVWFHQNIALLSIQGRDSYPLRADYRYQTGISLAGGEAVATPPIIKAADIDADGDDDLVVFVSGRLEILLQGAAGFEAVYRVPNQPAQSANVLPHNVSANIADFNGDGCLDLGHLRRSYVINYRVDCPASATSTVNAVTTRIRLQQPARPAKVQRTRQPQPRRGQQR